MLDHGYKLLELTGSSMIGIEDAVQKAIAKASQTVRHIHWFTVTATRGSVMDGKVAHWQISLKIGFYTRVGLCNRSGLSIAAACDRRCAFYRDEGESSPLMKATIGDARTFKSGREFASFLGLVPRRSGTGGKVRLGSISKRGDPYLRTLLIHGARSVMCHAKVPTVWQKEVQVRRPANVAALALANKMARTAWAILAHDRAYQKDYVSVKPA